MRPAPPTFDICGPLPQGTTVLEASAGTGKTHTIAGLAVRYLAEGVASIDELMLVTFGRAATVELRERVRERLVQAVTGLANPAAARASDDELLRHLATPAPGSEGTLTGRDADAEVARRRERLESALANFDAATIATTHGFCHQMLAGLGVAADVDADATFAEATGDLVADVVTDLYVAAYGSPDSPPATITFGTASKVATAAVGDRVARLEPTDAEVASEAGARRRLAERTRDVVAERKRSMRVMDYDDLLLHLRNALADPETGEDACLRIRARYRIVLVDEFQDTDPVQWEILERAFHRHRTLVLIGDPKQAIYAFRGADVVTYLLAAGSSADRATLSVNWRSDKPLVDALRHVMGGVALGDPEIVVHEVAAAHDIGSVVGAPVDVPLRIRRVPRAEFGVEETKPVAVGRVRQFVAADVAGDIVRLLASGAEVVEETTKRRPLQPGDVAVLVHRNEDGRTIREALAAAGVPVVLLGVTSVFLSRAARDWLTLLAALKQPHRPGLARSAALTDFVGWSTALLATADEQSLDELGAELRSWAEVLTDRGVAALLETVVATRGLIERVLARDQGERDLTDLRHVGQVLHEAAAVSHGGVATLMEWLQRRIEEARSDVTEERSRRLESDAEAVQVLTVHRSKGLEYPVVYAPFLWDRWVDSTPDLMRLHDDTGARVLDVGGKSGPGYAERKAAHLAEDAGESLRLAYVALTRARAHVVTHWAPTSNTATAPLHRMLFGERSDEGALPSHVPLPTDRDVRKRLTEIAERAGGGIRVETAGSSATGMLPREVPEHVSLEVRAFDRPLDRTWARTSYSGLTAGLHDHPGAGHGEVVSEPEVPGVVDEPVPGADEVEPGADGASAPDAPATRGVDEAHQQSPMAGLPAGAAFGTLVHGVLEEMDFASADLRGDLVTACQDAGSERFLGVRAADLADALLPSLLTPLGPLAGDRRLCDVAEVDRLDELNFELPLVGGDLATGVATLGQIADLLRDHLPEGDPLVAYPEDLASPLLAARQMRGFLAGSIDVVLRLSEQGGPSRYVVADYKTNWLGGEPTVTAWHYRPEAMTRAMRAAHYPLQALLYSVALHRFLRWRQPGYDPAVHLGGVLYLFLRGMCGPTTPIIDGTPCGVFSWSPSAALVTDLSDLLDSGGAR